ncbi:MAG: ABC transporter substrate-binding protein [Gemmatimonadota bacterium]
MRAVGAIAGVAAAVTLFACGPGEPPIRIGATLSETGAYSTQGIPTRNGYRLCEAHVNEEGAVLGRRVEFIIHDDASSSQEAIRLYEQLLTEDGVDAVIGPYGSTLIAAVAPVTEAHGQVLISPLAATTSIWEQGYRYLFMVLAMAASALDDFITMVRQMEAERVALEMFGTSGAVDEFRDALGAAADFTYGLSAWEPSLPHPDIDAFVEAYQTASV